MINLRALIVCSVSAVALGFAGGAMAKPPNNGKNANQGNQGCVLLAAPGQTFKNPGKMFQYIRANSDTLHAGADANQNPVQWLANFPGYTGNVGDFINRNCKVLD